MKLHFVRKKELYGKRGKNADFRHFLPFPKISSIGVFRFAKSRDCPVKVWNETQLLSQESLLPEMNFSISLKTSLNIDVQKSWMFCKWTSGKMLVQSFNPFPKQALVFTCLQYKSFENTAGKGEIARNEQFLLFPQRFLSVFITFWHFHQFHICCLQTL